MEKTNEEPINRPARSPITNIMITTTIATDSARFNKNVFVASAAILSSGYSTSTFTPIGICKVTSSIIRLTPRPVFTTSLSPSVATPIPIARLPSTRINVVGGSRYSRSIRAISPSRYCLPFCDINN